MQAARQGGVPSVQVGMCTHRGPKRGSNQDLAGYRTPRVGSDEAARGALFVVADGMGGHQAGEVASRTAVEMVIREYYVDTEPQHGERLVRAVKAANRAIHDHAALDPSRAGMGTTLVAAAVVGSRVYVANVGDSRAYLLARTGDADAASLKQITVDHSWVAEQVEEGLLTREQMAGHPQRNLITRALGAQPSVVVDLFKGDLVDGDTLLLCSDGVCGAVPEARMIQILGRAAPQDAAEELVARAALHGGDDNATALVVHVAAGAPVAGPAGSERWIEGLAGQGVEGDAGPGADARQAMGARESRRTRVEERARRLVAAALPRRKEVVAKLGLAPSPGARARPRVLWIAGAALLLALVCLCAWAVVTSVASRTRTDNVAPIVAPIGEAQLGALSEAELAEYLGYGGIEEMQARHAGLAGSRRWPAEAFVLLVGQADKSTCEESGACTFTLKVAEILYTVHCPRPTGDDRLDGERVRVLAAVVDPASRTLTAALVERDIGSKKREHDWKQIVGELPDKKKLWVYGIIDDLSRPADRDRGTGSAERRVLVLAIWPGAGASLPDLVDTYVYQVEGSYRLPVDSELTIAPQPTATLRAREGGLP
jgi:serine/threonine protein phosphatase PrpC